MCTANLSQTDWSSRFAGAACGDPTDSDCDHADTCDGAGSCLTNVAPPGTACTDGNDCTRDTCLAGACTHRTWAFGTPCGDPSTSDCDNADICDGFGRCDSNHQSDGLACTGDGAECTQDICDTGACSHPPQPPGTSCGDDSSTQCDHRDTCDGAGVCMGNLETAGAACGNPTDTDCDHPDSCNGSGACVENLEPVISGVDGQKERPVGRPMEGRDMGCFPIHEVDLRPRDAGKQNENENRAQAGHRASLP